MKLNDMFYDLLSLAEQENEPNRYAHSEEYDKLFNELDRKTLIIDELEKEVGCPLEIVLKAVLRWIYYEDTMGNITRDYVDLHTNLDGEYVLLRNNGREVFFTKDYKKTWWLKKDMSE